MGRFYRELSVRSLLALLPLFVCLWRPTVIMSSYAFEIALFGEFFPNDLKPILNRIAMNSDSAQQMHSREIVFEPLDMHQQRDQGQEPVLLRARKELIEADSGWYVSSASLLSPWVLVGCGENVH